MIERQGATTAKPMPKLTDEEEIIEIYSRARKIDRNSYEYYESHFDELQDSHGGNIVAIVDNSIIDEVEYPAESATLDSFIERVRREYGDDAFITHIPEPHQSLIL